MWFSIFYRILAPILLAASSLAVIDEAWPCSVCYSAKSASLTAYYGTTLIMTLLPISMVLLLVWWFHTQR